MTGPASRHVLEGAPRSDRSDYESASECSALQRRFSAESGKTDLVGSSCSQKRRARAINLSSGVHCSVVTKEVRSDSTELKISLICVCWADSSGLLHKLD